MVVPATGFRPARKRHGVGDARRTPYADLKKSLPRIPRVRDFRGFAAAGRKLSDLHLGYEATATSL